MSDKRLLALVFLAIGVTFFCFIISTEVSQANLSDCGNCHDSAVNDFELSPPLPEACAVCHNHPLMSKRHTYPKWTAVYLPVAGYFKSEDSLAIKPPDVHNLHSGMNNPAGNSACASCHSTVDCETCHQPVLHKQHGSTDISSYPEYIVAYGTNSEKKKLSCATSQCHNFYAPYTTGIAVHNSNGNQLCLNCHSTDKAGHTEETLAPVHGATDTTLKIGISNYNVSCQGCHLSSLSAEHSKVAANKGLPEGQECGYCHGANAEPTVISVVELIKTVNQKETDSSVKIRNRNCTKCHFDLTVLPAGPSEHVVYHIAKESDSIDISGSPHANCNTCHNNPKLFGTIAELARTPISEREYSCFSCHNEKFDLEPIHMASFDGEGSEITSVHPGCGTCHTPGTETSQKIQEIIGRLADGESTYQCIDCHDGDALDEGHTAIIDSNCTTSCHESTLTREHLNNPITQVNNVDNPLTCGSCHNDPASKLAIVTGNTDCAACHNQAHNLNIIQSMPQDISKHDGFIWSTPQDSAIWANEPWYNERFNNTKRITSNRRNDVTIESLRSYYWQNMESNGWRLYENLVIQNTTLLSFSKGQRTTIILLYSTDIPFSSNQIAAGCRVELFYK